MLLSTVGRSDGRTVSIAAQLGSVEMPSGMLNAANAAASIHTHVLIAMVESVLDDGGGCGVCAADVCFVGAVDDPPASSLT